MGRAERAYRAYWGSLDGNAEKGRSRISPLLGEWAFMVLPEEKQRAWEAVATAIEETLFAFSIGAVVMYGENHPQKYVIVRRQYEDELGHEVKRYFVVPCPLVNRTARWVREQALTLAS